MKGVAKLAVMGSLVALLVGGCSSNQATPKPSVTGADVTACHDFGNEVIIHGATTSSAELARLMDEVGLAQNTSLRREANAMQAAIAAKNADLEKSIANQMAGTCYALRLVSKTGQPT